MAQSSLQKSNSNETRAVEKMEASHREASDQLKKQLTDVQTELSTIQKRCHLVEKTNHEYKSRMNSKSKELDDHKTQLNRAMEDSAKAKAVMSRKENEHRQHKQALLDDHARALEETRRSYQRELGQLPMLQNALQQLTVARDQAIAQVAALRQQQADTLTNATQQVSTLKQQLRHLDNAHTEAVNTAQSLNQQLQDSRTAHVRQAQDLTRQVDEVTAAAAATQAQTDKQQETSHTNHTELRQYMNKMRHLYSTNEADIAALKADMEKFNRERDTAFIRSADGRKALVAEMEKTRAPWSGARAPADVGRVL